jgi:hypothetical protein
MVIILKYPKSLFLPLAALIFFLFTIYNCIITYQRIKWFRKCLKEGLYDVYD